jgi:uncharacterized protein YdeI (YjbR/CyaY-like superfamily)
MGTRDKRVDAYIKKAAPFAQPILAHLRDVVHEACPEVVETLKWRSPSFEYKGLLAGMASFKAHCVFGFWKHEQVVGSSQRADAAMGSFGRLTTMADLPSKRELTRLIKVAKKLNDDGVKAVRRKTVKGPFAVPPELAAALAKNAKARATFEGFPPSKQRDYVAWIVEAKQDATRARRLATTVQWLAEGKSRNWKYESC